MKTKGVNIEGTIRGGGYFYVGTGLENLFISIDKQFADNLPCENGKRVAMNLRVGKEEYKAGIRVTENYPFIWISPNLQNDLKLVDVLDRNGFVKNDTVSLKVSGKEIRLLLPSNLDEALNDN